MVKVVIVGKSELLQQLAWCRKYSDYKPGSDAQAKAQSAIALNRDLMVSVSDSALDTNGVIPKMEPMGFMMPSANEVEILTGIFFTELEIFSLFLKNELIPGRPDFEFGMGFSITTGSIFLEDRMYNVVETVDTESKFGGLMKKEKKSTRRRLKQLGDLYGVKVDGESRMIMLGHDTDNRGNRKISVQILHNVNKIGKDKTFVAKLGQKWSDDKSYLARLVKEAKVIEQIINQTFSLVGYDTPPEYAVFLGPIDAERKIGSLSKEDIDGTAVIDVSYQ